MRSTEGQAAKQIAKALDHTTFDIGAFVYIFTQQMDIATNLRIWQILLELIMVQARRFESGSYRLEEEDMVITAARLRDGLEMFEQSEETGNEFSRLA